MDKQKHFLQLFFLLMILQIEFSTCDISRVRCTMYETNRKCTISSIITTSKNSTFVPVAPDARAVVKFEIIKSIVSVLTSNICTTFNNLKYFTAVGQHIEIVEDYAFNNCTDMLDINLEKNNIHKLGTGIFSNTKKLQRLHMLGGSVQHIDDDLFSNLGELNQLLYSANGLKELPVAAIRNLKKLELLYLYSNDLSDLDAEGLVENLPKLKSIYINDNNFHCDRLIEIVDIFKGRKVKILDHTFDAYNKKRDYIPVKVSNIICLSQAQLQAEQLKTALTGSLDTLKALPLGKEIFQLKEIVTSGFTDSDSEIVALSNTLNEMADSVNEQISNLNETLQNTTIEISDTVSGLKNDIETVQQHSEQTLNETVAKIQKLEDSIASLLNKYDNIMIDSIKSDKLIENNSRPVESLSHNMVAMWVCLVCLFLFIVTIGLFVIKKFKKVYVDVPFLFYEDRIDRVG